MLSLHTIAQGDRLSLWSRAGRVLFVDGPRRTLPFREQAEPDKHNSVELDQSLIVHRQDGQLERIAGILVELAQLLVASFRSPDQIVQFEGGSSATPSLHIFANGSPCHE